MSKYPYLHYQDSIVIPTINYPIEVPRLPIPSIIPVTADVADFLEPRSAAQVIQSM